MPLYYKIDVIEALRKNGYSSYRIRQEKLIGESTLSKLRQKKPISWENIETLCKLLDAQPEQIIGYTKEDSAET